MSPRTWLRNGPETGGTPAKPARVSTWHAYRSRRCATVESQVSPDEARPGMRIIGRPRPVTVTAKERGVAGAGEVLAGVGTGSPVAPSPAAPHPARRDVRTRTPVIGALDRIRLFIMVAVCRRPRDG